MRTQIQLISNPRSLTICGKHSCLVLPETNRLFPHQGLQDHPQRTETFSESGQRQRALIIRSDELEVTSARARGQVCVIIVSAAESSRALHLCVIWREIRAGNGYSSIKQQSGLSPATKPHG